MLKGVFITRTVAGLSHWGIQHNVSRHSKSCVQQQGNPISTHDGYTFSVQSSLQETMHSPPLLKAAPHTVDV